MRICIDLDGVICKLKEPGQSYSDLEPVDGAPDKLVAGAKGFVWQASVSEEQYENMKENFPIISTIPSGTGWEIQFVGEKPADIEAREIHPNLEHAYVHFMENTLNHWKQ